MPRDLAAELRGTSRCDYGAHIFERDQYKCVYCGFDGTSFTNWLQLTVDHIRRTGSRADEADDNKVTCCPTCNSMTANVKELKELSKDLPRDEYFKRKRGYIQKSRQAFFKFWHQEVARP